MHANVLLVALAEVLAMLLVGVGYFVASRRARWLAHPLSIIAFVTLVGVVVSVLGEVWRAGWTGVPAMTARSAIGSAGWGVIIAGLAWAVQRGLDRWRR